MTGKPKRKCGMIKGREMEVWFGKEREVEACYDWERETEVWFHRESEMKAGFDEEREMEV